jgi:sugar phosphate isomerase/epimerase
MIYIGMNDRLFPSNWRPITQDISFAQAHGFTPIQFHGRPNGLGADELGASLEATGAALRDAHVGAVMEIIVRLDAACRTPEGKLPIDVLEANLPAIESLGCTHVHWHPVQSERLDASGLRALEARLYEQLTAGVALSRAYGFRFGFEHNEPATGLFGEPEYCAAALEAVPDVGFVWDVNHTRPDQLDAYLAFAPRMSMLHLADTPLPVVNHHLPIGMGNIDFGYCFHELLRAGFDGPGILEIGGLPRSGGYGRDTDVALIESRTKLLNILQKETNDE